MAEQIVNAATNSALANDLVAKALVEEQVVEPAKIIPPSNIIVNLPAGLYHNGEVIKTAEVRELNGRDEEAIVRADSTSKVFSVIINRATTTLGDYKATEDMLDRLLIGDRDALLLGIYRATFGDTAEVGAYCGGCNEQKIVAVDVVKDIKTKILPDPVGDSKFLVKGRTKEFLVALPSGLTQKKLLANPAANLAESMSILLEQTVLEIDGKMVISKEQVKALGIVDRKTIADAIANRNPGPQFDDLTITCPDCESEVQVPISLGTMFRF